MPSCFLHINLRIILSDKATKLRSIAILPALLYSSFVDATLLFPGFTARGFGRTEGFFQTHRPLAAVEVGDAIACYPKELGCRLLHGLQQPAAFHELSENVLREVFGLGFVGNAAADKLQQSGPQLPHGVGNLVVLLRSRHRKEGRGEQKCQGFHCA